MNNGTVKGILLIVLVVVHNRNTNHMYQLSHNQYLKVADHKTRHLEHSCRILQANLIVNNVFLAGWNSGTRIYCSVVTCFFYLFNLCCAHLRKQERVFKLGTVEGMAEVFRVLYVETPFVLYNIVCYY